MKKWKSVLCGGLALAMAAVCLPACGESGNGGKVELLVDLHGWMPSSSTVTSAGSQPYKATQQLADEFMKLNPDIKISWATTKPVGGTEDEVATWFTTRISNGACPAIAFSWGTVFQDRGWYVDLTDYLEEANPYEEGNTRWADNFEDYLWELNTVSNARDEVVAIPLVLYSGTPTGYYYNKTIFEDAGVESEPQTWKEFTELVADLKTVPGVSTAFAPTADISAIEYASWPYQFSIGPAYAAKMRETLDLDGDGRVSQLETLKGVIAGAYNPETYEGAREMLAVLKEYYNSTLESGWDTKDYLQNWIGGSVAIREQGLWAYNTEASTAHNGNYKWDVMPTPLVDTDSSNFVRKAEFTESGVSNPLPDLQVNIMEPAVRGKPEVLDAAVKFLKFLTTKENNEYMVGAKDSGLPSVKGAEYPPTISESGFLDKSFPVVPTESWPTAYTTEQSANLNTLFKNWVNNTSVDPRDYDAAANKTFYAEFNRIQQAGAQAFIQKMGITL